MSSTSNIDLFELSDSLLPTDTGSGDDTDTIDPRALQAYLDRSTSFGLTQDVAAEAGVKLPADANLVITRHEIHREDQLAEGGTELITSTLKHFVLIVELRDGHGHPITEADGTAVHAMLLYEDTTVCEDLSVTMEPCLLSNTGTLDGGSAFFKLRVTVLTSLCQSRRFRVHVALAGREDVCVVTAPFKTITKLRRTAKGSSAAAEAKREAAEALAAPLPPLAGVPGAVPPPPSGGAGGQAAPPTSKRALSASAQPHPCAKGPMCTRGGAHACGDAAAPCRTGSRGAGASSSAVAAAAAAEGSGGSGRTLNSLWDEVSANGQKLQELQAQQARLFAELRALRDADAAGDGGTVLPRDFASRATEDAV